MSMNFVMNEVAAQYGLAYAFDSNVLGSVTSGFWRGDARIGYLRTYYLDTANGFRWAFDTVTLDDSSARITGVNLIRGDTFVWSASGEASSPYPQFNLSTIFDGDDTFTGNSGANVFLADAGNDTIDGGAGVDTVFYALNSSGAGIARTDSGLTVTSSFGTDTLRNVERIAFADKSIAFDVAGTAGQAYRLYQAAFNRTPDPGGLGFNMHSLDLGLTLPQVAAQFISSAEFQQTYGNVTDAQWVTLLYQNVLHRAPEQAGFDFHLWELSVGLSRAEQLAEFSESPENQANLISVMQQGMVYWPVQ